MTMAGRRDAELVASAEQLLAGHPDFGNSDLIQRRAEERLHFALEILGHRLPAVRAALSQPQGNSRWRQLLRDPVVRMTTETALVRLRDGELNPADDLGQVLELAAGYSNPAGDADCMPTQAEEGGGLRAGPDQSIWLLSFPDPAGPLTRRLEHACQQAIDSPGQTARLVPGTTQAAGQLQNACALLLALLPSLGRGVLRHVTAVGLVTAAGTGRRMLSAVYGDILPGTLVAAPDLLGDTWEMAACLLHEGMHLKLVDITHCTPLSSATEDTEIPVPWRGIRWPVRHVVAAFHVYAHVELFQAAVRAHGGNLAADFGNPTTSPGVSAGNSARYARSDERLRYLGEQLTGPLAGYLTSAGRRFARWIADAIAPLIGWQPAAPSVVRTQVHSDHPVRGYEQTRELLRRPAPDLECLYVFNPVNGILHVVNLAAWAAFEFCDGRNLAALRAAYAELVSSKLPAAEAARQLDIALTQLGQAGLIQPASNGRR